MDEVRLKECNRCHQSKDRDACFARRSDGLGDGYSAHCLQCQAERNKRYYAEHREKLSARSLQRKEQIKAGTWQKIRDHGSKRRVDAPAPEAPDHLAVCHLDRNEWDFVCDRAEQRGITTESLLRELVHALMEATPASPKRVSKPGKATPPRKDNA